MCKYVVEVLNGRFVCNSEKEARDLAEGFRSKWKVTVQVFPEEPELSSNPYEGICEVCLSSPAESGEYLCNECLTKMIDDMSKE